MDLRRSRRWLLPACLMLALSPPAAAQSGVDEVRECLKRNLPEHSSSQTLEFVYQHPARGERDCKARVFGTRAAADGHGAGKVCMIKPPDIAGVQMLSNEVEDGPPRTRLYLPELGHAKRLAGGQLSGRVCGSDVSYEDLQRMQQLNRPEEFERLPDSMIEGHGVFVLQAKPIDPSQSSYTKVLSYVDKVTCVVLRSESFQNGDRLRKVMNATPDDLLEARGIRVPARAVVEDLREESRTTITADDFRVDEDVNARNFTDESLERRCH